MNLIPGLLFHVTPDGKLYHDEFGVVKEILQRLPLTLAPGWYGYDIVTGEIRNVDGSPIVREEVKPDVVVEKAVTR